MTFICIIFIERSCRSHAVSMYCVSVARCPTNTHFLCILSMHANFVLVRIDSEIYSVLLRWLVFCVFFFGVEYSYRMMCIILSGNQLTISLVCVVIRKSPLHMYFIVFISVLSVSCFVFHCFCKCAHV